MHDRNYRGERYQGWVDPRLRVPPPLLNHPERASEFPSATTLLNCRGRQITRLNLDFDDVSSPCFLHYFRNSSAGRSLRSCYSLRTLRISEKLKSHGFRVPEVVAALKKRGELLNWHSLLIAREITGSCEVPSGGQHVFRIHPSCEMTSDLRTRLARELARFHRSGFFHGDLKSRHILVQLESGGPPRFHFVDLEKCLHLPGIPGFLNDILASRDLIQFLSSLPAPPDGQEPEADQFLQCYLSASGRPRSGRNRIEKILSLYRLEGPLRQGRPLLSSLALWLTRKGSSAP